MMCQVLYTRIENNLVVIYYKDKNGYEKKVIINDYWLNHISYENYLFSKNKKGK